MFATCLFECLMLVLTTIIKLMSPAPLFSNGCMIAQQIITDSIQTILTR